MQIDKQQILDLLKSRGDHDQAQAADIELPDKVDTDKDGGLLSKFGIDPQELPALLSSLVDKAGGLQGIRGKLGL
jgi:hypothetical protein